MAHKHSVYDTDPHFAINPTTRVIRDESSSKTTLIQLDHNSERFTFEIPRFVDGHDMSLCDAVEIHYLNSDSVTKESYKGLYAADDVQVSPASDDMVIFSWLVSQNATQYVGALSFQIRFVCMTGNVVDYAWHTAIYAGILVSDGYYHSDDIATEYADVLAQFEKRLAALEENSAEAGEDGGYYVPSVSNDGELTWKPSKADMPEVTGSNIKGDPGYSPVKGKDYFTEAEKQEMIDEVIEGTKDLGIAALSVTEEEDGGVTVVETMSDGTTNTTIISVDENGTPETLTRNGSAIPITWTEVGA